MNGFTQGKITISPYNLYGMKSKGDDPMKVVLGLIYPALNEAFPMGSYEANGHFFGSVGSNYFRIDQSGLPGPMIISYHLKTDAAKSFVQQAQVIGGVAK
jgi:hypothetical protein